MELADVEDTSAITELKALHEEEMAQLKISHAEDLNIFAEDLQEEKSKTARANRRAAKSNNELKTPRNNFKELQSHATAVDKRIQELEAQLVQEQRKTTSFIEEATKAYELAKEKDSIIEQDQQFLAQYRSERDRVINEGRRIYQEGANSRNEVIDQLQGQITGLNHQLPNAFTEYKNLQLDQDVVRQ